MENLSQRGIETGEGVVAEAGGFAHLSLGESFALAIENQLRVVDESHAVGVSKSLGAFADKINMRAAFENQASSLNGIAEPLDAGDAAGLHATAIHEERIELDMAVRGKKAATTGVKGGVIFEDGDGGFHCVEG